jgi:hypothetical protein
LHAESKVVLLKEWVVVRPILGTTSNSRKAPAIKKLKFQNKV